MKFSLYNLYKQVILESGDVAPTIEDIQKAIDGHYMVNFRYISKNSSNTVRYCGIYAIGTTDGGNVAVRIHQAAPSSKANHTGEPQQWKTLILQKMRGWNPTKMKFHAPADAKYNINGDKTLNITYPDGGGSIASFSDKNMDKQRGRHSGWQSNIDTKQQNKPLEKGRGDSINNPVTNYEYTPYEKPQVNQKPRVKQEPQVQQEPQVNNRNDYPNDEDNPNDENI